MVREDVGSITAVPLQGYLGSVVKHLHHAITRKSAQYHEPVQAGELTEPKNGQGWYKYMNK